jgi:predicted ester cyclase
MDRNEAVVAGILKVVNDRDYDLLETIMAPDFLDHHPGIGDDVTSGDAYLRTLRYVHQTLDMSAQVDVSFAVGDRVVTRVLLKGRHVGPFLGIAPTGRPVEWVTMEVYRVQDDRIRERWALDDMLGLLTQLGVEVPA